MPLSLEKAALIGTFLEALVYGAYLPVFVECLNVLHRRYATDWRPSIFLLLTTVILFVFATIHLAIDIDRAVDAFTSNEAVPNAAALFYNHIQSPGGIVKQSIYVALTVVSDAFMVYRYFIVWGRGYLVTLVPFVLFLAEIAMGILGAYTLGRITPNQPFYARVLSMCVQAFYATTLALNALCTFLIAFKIWTIQNITAQYSNTGNFAVGSRVVLSRIAVIIIESGAVYSAMLTALIGLYARNSMAMFIILDATTAVIGIVFSSVIVRMGLGVSHGDTSIPPSTLRFANANKQHSDTMQTNLGSRLGSTAMGEVHNPDVYPSASILKAAEDDFRERKVTNATGSSSTTLQV